MKRLGPDKRALIVRCLAEGVGTNAMARMACVSKNTILKLLADLGPVCRRYQAGVLPHTDCGPVRVHQQPATSGMRIWVATCASCGLALSWLVDPRDTLEAQMFLRAVAIRIGRPAHHARDGHGRQPSAPRVPRTPPRISRKVENLRHAVDIGFMVYNFVRSQGRDRISAAMRAGLADRRWRYEDVV